LKARWKWLASGHFWLQQADPVPWVSKNETFTPIPGISIGSPSTFQDCCHTVVKLRIIELAGDAPLKIFPISTLLTGK
jgi:hypothetical protein